METNKQMINKQTREYFSASKESILRIKEELPAKVSVIKNKNGYISLSINDMQQILSLEISPILLETPDKSNVESQIKNILNHAIRLTNNNIMNMLKNHISLDEFNRMLLNEDQIIIENITTLQNNIRKAFIDMPIMIKEYITADKIISIKISRAKIIVALNISHDCITKQNKQLIEKNLIYIVNTAIQKIQDENYQLLNNYEMQYKEIILGK